MTAGPEPACYIGPCARASEGAPGAGELTDEETGGDRNVENRQLPQQLARTIEPIEE
jgi:hypothetical protein